MNPHVSQRELAKKSWSSMIFDITDFERTKSSSILYYLNTKIFKS